MKNVRLFYLFLSSAFALAGLVLISFSIRELTSRDDFAGLQKALVLSLGASMAFAVVSWWYMGVLWYQQSVGGGINLSGRRERWKRNGAAAWWVGMVLLALLAAISLLRSRSG